MRAVIIGNGVAGITTATHLRRARPDVDIAIYSQESHHYYPRPRLMDVMAGSVAPERIISHAGYWHQENDLQGILGCRVAALKAHDYEIVLGNISEVAAGCRLVERGTLVSEDDGELLWERFDLQQLIKDDRSCAAVQWGNIIPIALRR